MENKKSLPQTEKDFKQLVLNMLPPEEVWIVNKLSASDLYYLVYSVYNPYFAVKQVVDSSYMGLNINEVYKIIISLRDVRDELYEEIK